MRKQKLSRSLGHLIYREMRSRGIKQAYLAENLGVSERTVRRMATKGAPTSEKFLTRISGVLKVSRLELEQAIMTGSNYLITAGKDYIQEQLGWTARQLLERLRHLDHDAVSVLQNYDLDENPHEANLDELVSVYWDHPDTWRVIFDDEKNVVGYWHFDVLWPDKYEQARLGALLDNQMTSEAIMPLSISDWYDIYVAFFGVAPTYDNASANTVRRLFESLLDVIDFLSDDERGMYINRVCANALGANAFRLCKRFGMKEIAKHSVEGVVFEGNLEAILGRAQSLISPRRKNQYDRLVERYTSQRRVSVELN